MKGKLSGNVSRMTCALLVRGFPLQCRPSVFSSFFFPIRCEKRKLKHDQYICKKRNANAIWRVVRNIFLPLQPGPACDRTLGYGTLSASCFRNKSAPAFSFLNIHVLPEAVSLYPYSAAPAAEKKSVTQKSNYQYYSLELEPGTVGLSTIFYRVFSTSFCTAFFEIAKWPRIKKLRHLTICHALIALTAIIRIYRPEYSAPHRCRHIGRKRRTAGEICLGRTQMYWEQPHSDTGLPALFLSFKDKNHVLQMLIAATCKNSRFWHRRYQNVVYVHLPFVQMSIGS